MAVGSEVSTIIGRGPMTTMPTPRKPASEDVRSEAVRTASKASVKMSGMRKACRIKTSPATRKPKQPRQPAVSQSLALSQPTV